MSCYHPMVMLQTSDMTDPGQRKIVRRLSLSYRHRKSHPRSASTLIIPRELAEKEGIKLRESNATIIPCGSCIGCRLDYSRQWAERCVHEASKYNHNHFLTLTYDDEHLPYGSKGLPTLVKDEVSTFMKRFREHMRDKYGLSEIRFFACGEYGDLEKRPHYHIILFNCPITDFSEWHPMKVDGKMKNIHMYGEDGEMLLYSKDIASCWNKGSCPVGKVTFESCAYVSRYIVKKQKGNAAKVYDDCGIIPEFVVMSRKPGIGYDWYMAHLDEIYTYDSYNMRRGDKVYSVKPGRYCDKLLQKENEQAFYDIKKHRKEAFYDSIESKAFEGVDLSKNLQNCEEVHNMLAKQLKRSL